jgi:hypothetical protein
MPMRGRRSEKQEDDWSAASGRYLLCLVQLHGYGNWERIRSELRRCERFRFDYTLLGRGTDEVRRECERLMREAEREQEVKKETGAERQKREQREAALALWTTQMEEQSNALNADLAAVEKQVAEAEVELAEAEKTMKKQLKKGGGAQGGGGGGGPSRPVAAAQVLPESLFGELITEIKEAGPKGKEKLVDGFLELHPGSVSKRQLALHIDSLAVKEKRAGDSAACWHLRTPNATPATMMAAAKKLNEQKSGGGKGAAAKRKKGKEETAKGGSAAAGGAERKAKKAKAEGGGGAGGKAKKDGDLNPGAKKKKKVADAAAGLPWDGSVMPKPKKAKSSFVLWSLHHRKVTKAELIQEHHEAAGVAMAEAESAITMADVMQVRPSPSPARCRDRALRLCPGEEGSCSEGLRLCERLRAAVEEAAVRGPVVLARV